MLQQPLGLQIDEKDLWIGFIDCITNNFYTRILERLEQKMFLRIVGRGDLRKGQKFQHIIRASNKPTLLMRGTFIQKKL